ncbi:MAG: FAD-dependent thymidylate synthase [Campylobacterales bacterium]|nr:FAD-dependent thymidylate synthase [Campylobacterales bacterium]
MIEMINKKENIFGDSIAFVENWDFSKANLSEENRIKAITQVASICYQSPNAIGSENLYNRLKAESIGLPSSSFEFVPVLLDMQNNRHSELLKFEFSSIKKFGEVVEERYYLTNYRAILFDYEKNKNGYSFDITKLYNTQTECEIIKKYFHIFLFKVDLPTRSQMVRHRVSWQELSRRYVSGKRVPFEFYYSQNLNDDETKKIVESCVNHYYKLLENGIKPQEARRVIPQMAYTQIWGAFYPSQLDNFFKLRCDVHAQLEIQQVALTMKELIEKQKEFS